MCYPSISSTMKKLIIILLPLLLIACKTIEKKSEKVINKENERLSKFIRQPESELKIVMGEPDEITYDDKGSTFFIYSKKKYNILCVRKFEIDKNKIIVGFSSKGCF